MDYLKKYGLTEEQITNLKDRYNDGIINFLEENNVFVINIIEYLYSEEIKCIYLLMINNIKIFLETKVALERRIKEMKRKGMDNKKIQLELLKER